MKGIVFTEFLEMVEDRYSLAMVDQILEAATPGAGVYTAVGSYNYRELVRLVEELARATHTPPHTLVKAFGRYLFTRFTALYPHFFVGTQSAFEFLSKVDQHIHIEVLKLYPEAELPRFTWRELPPDGAEMTYHSSRPFADLAEGLIEGCIWHYGGRIQVERLDQTDHTGTTAVFRLTRSGGP
ncbi:MAG: heme NO-binding domain-containing protein [Gemmataceae bacterium]